MNAHETHHVSVLKSELCRRFSHFRGGTIIDCTAGFGGHIEYLLEITSDDVSVVGIDRDADANAYLAEKFANHKHRSRVKIVKGAFSSIATLIEENEISKPIVGIYADIGVSSYQLDQEQRGFSFIKPGPLDMSKLPILDESLPRERGKHCPFYRGQLEFKHRL